MGKKNVKVVLTASVRGQGKPMDIRYVRRGFAVYLQRQKLAALATEDKLAEVKARLSEITEREAQIDAKAREQVKRLPEFICFVRNASSQGRLYGSIDVADLCQIIHELSGIKLQRTSIQMVPVRSLGLHTATLHLAPTVDAQIQFHVVTSDADLVKLKESISKGNTSEDQAADTVAH